MATRDLWKVKWLVKSKFGPGVVKTIWLVCDGLGDVTDHAGDNPQIEGVVKARMVREVEVVGLEDLVVVEEARVKMSHGEHTAALEILDSLLKSDPGV